MDIVDSELGYALPVDTSVRSERLAFNTRMCFFTGKSVAFWASEWTVADYKSKYAISFDIRRFDAMIFNGQNVTICDLCAVRHGTDIGCGNRDWSLMQSGCHRCDNLVDFSYMLLVSQENESNYVLRFVALLGRPEEVKVSLGLNT